MMKKNIQPYLFWLLLIFLVAGIFYPIIGIIALTCMLAPVILAIFKGRYWCGNFCPRGSFYDTIISKISPQRPIPAIFSNTKFRTFILLLVMGIFSLQTYHAWGDFKAIGEIFVRIILVTTIIGILLGVIYHQRTWCTFCPMGTLSNWLANKNSRRLIVADSCITCKLCKKVCPLNLTPYIAKSNSEGFTNADCLKCGLCIEKCPKKALSFQDFQN